MQYYVILDEQKYIKQYTNQPTEGFETVTIDPADADSLGEYANKMWVDDNGLVHADNLPFTEQQKELNQLKADIQTSQQQVESTIGDMQDKITEANNASQALDTKLANFNKVISLMTAQVAKIQSSSTSQTK